MIRCPKSRRRVENGEEEPRGRVVVQRIPAGSANWVHLGRRTVVWTLSAMRVIDSRYPPTTAPWHAHDEFACGQHSENHRSSNHRSHLPVRAACLQPKLATGDCVATATRSPCNTISDANDSRCILVVCGGVYLVSPQPNVPVPPQPIGRSRFCRARWQAVRSLPERPCRRWFNAAGHVPHLTWKTTASVATIVDPVSAVATM
jgi:hypothetical protein